MPREGATYRTLSPMMHILLRVWPFIIIGVLGPLFWSAVAATHSFSAALQRVAPILIVGAIVSALMLRISHTIVLRVAEEAIEFRTFMGTRIVPVHDIVSIAPAFLQHGQLIVRYGNGWVLMPNQFGGLHEILQWMRSRNPRLAMRGI